MGGVMASSEIGLASADRPVRKTGLWDDVEIQHLIQLWRKGRSNAQIASALGRNENAVAIKASRLNLPPKHHVSTKFSAENAKINNSRIRPCLCCARDFFSEGSGHRICDLCKSTSAWSSGDYAISFGGSSR